MNDPPRAGEPWLPDLCRLPRLATMFGVAELVVLILALAPDGGAHWNAQRFLSLAFRYVEASGCGTSNSRISSPGSSVVTARSASSGT